ncbi:Gluconate 5-dehydrogenase [Pseudobythopirellula maris]|uniref:Gluconate 5-dehydrogenase n=1 Tax=Pseudobythopirellula maris TaxID=2527991 RepID=A0A5C5ZTI5_9BACT|nr:SDR family oxidoreductase [Pseudobythopirellula maris]TWT90385.1 Gluconate 5-dehydrogenase [Pseudobythopirellula maris]
MSIDISGPLRFHSGVRVGTNAKSEGMRIDLTGKQAMVTGAGKGIGRTIATLLTECGAEVVALSRTREDLDSLSSEIGCRTLVTDLEDPEAAAEAARQAGDVDLLINNAGISIPQPFLNTSVESLDRTMSVNLRSVLVVSQIVARGMIERGVGGSIVNISSQASLVALADHASYCASKGALDQLTRVMALELGPHGIRVNSVNPTVTLTPMGEMAWAEPSKRDAMLAKIPLGRFAKPNEIAQAVAFLLSDHSGMINGVTLPIDGGYLIA